MLGNIKIRIKSPEHSAAVQEKLFEIGYGWADGKREVQYAEKPYLYVDDGVITFSRYATYFADSLIHEYIFTDEEIGYFPDASQPLPHHQGEVIIKNSTKPPIGLRPKYIADLERMEEILEAMSRYVEAKKRVPSDWLTEFDSLNQGVPEESFEEKMGRVLKGARI